jgi:hypothetical protein
MDIAALEKDSFAFQKARVTRICNELAPGKEVVFNNSRALINFYVRDTLLGTHTNLTEGSGDWVPSVLADKSDEELRDLIKRFSNGKIR